MNLYKDALSKHFGLRAEADREYSDAWNGDAKATIPTAPTAGIQSVGQAAGPAPAGRLASAKPAIAVGANISAKSPLVIGGALGAAMKRIADKKAAK